MARKQQLRFAVINADGPRCILSVAEKNDGTLILTLRSSDLNDDIGSPFNDGSQHADVDIIEYRYTVHISRESANEINVINLHYVLADGTERPSVQRTAAVKQNRRFTPLYARLCSALKSPRFDIKPQQKFESLGDIEPELTLMFAIFIGPTDEIFKVSAASFRYRQIHFQQFSIVILWSFLTMPAHNHNRMLHFATHSAELASPDYDPEECIRVFDYLRAELRRFNLDLLEREFQGSSNILQFYRRSVFVNSGTRDSPQYQAWISYLFEGDG